jgi:hypothetical protein
LEACARHNLHLAVAELPVALFDLPRDMARDRETITCLRSVLMKPEHLDWVDRIADIVGLEERKQRLDAEIRSYPTPIPRCDAQFNHLFEERDRIARRLEELARSR